MRTPFISALTRATSQTLVRLLRWGAGPRASDHPEIVRLTRYYGKHPPFRCRERDGTHTGLRVAKMDLAHLEVHMDPTQRKDLAAAGSR